MAEPNGQPLRPPAVLPSYTRAEEIAHGVTHGIGVVLAIVGLAALVAVAYRSGDVRRVVGFSIFGTTLILLYVASTLYHSIPIARAKPILRVLDHSAIFLLIAGTYTPFALVSLQGAWGWGILTAIWTLAVLGILLVSTPLRRYRAPAIVLYLTMGWLILVALGPLMRSLERGGLVLLVLGGILYTSGMIFYGWRRLPYHHAVWHLFVLMGSVLHFFAVLLYVGPR